MSKRCCAKNCFNSVLYNKSIAYFSFPKHKEFAHQWAELAGRADLQEKPINRLVKYYLCSEHFASNCFVDEDSRQILKRNLPHYIALPTIFKNNLQETMQHVNPRNSIEVHNIILLDVNQRLREHKIQKSEDDCCTSVSDSYSDQRTSPMNSDFHEGDNFKHDYMDMCPDEHPESSCSSNTINKPTHCRLCLSELQADDFKITFNDSVHLKEFIARIMQDRISVGDAMSQMVCRNCEKNALLCLIIVQQMDKAQEKVLPG